MDMTTTQEMVALYKRGLADGELARTGRRDEIEWLPWLVDEPVLEAFWQAGFAGASMPRWVRGWRLGAIPASGRSHNYRDNCAEHGVSLMAAEGCDSTPDGTFAIFHGDRERVEVEGWLVTHRTGSDGEPLVVGAVTVG